MSWKKENKKTPSDLEKGSDISSISSFGSPKKAIVALPPQAHHAAPPSPNTNSTFTHSGTEFTSSFPTSVGSNSNNQRSWVRRHAFVIMIAITLFLIAIIVTVLVLLKTMHARYTADIAPGSGLDTSSVVSLVLAPTSTPSSPDAS
ncbi:hypothetical protein FRB91_006167 [Serendipita sp. 411]|nr:hypothetical protein FRC18_001801 [Serendipita sp. 400]KAG8823226.1 hypothetical protein FRC19_004370 [Serendipita sp. 401]KAG8840370.1 hypothetical protein FRB91_006167 [Serendipita sp. 411]KAG8842621.1 hypothetical protein FRC20_004324 [Serendipita sp. 405]KAG9054680.1 hypothetical protein FS842_004455 [Serendipita sp. 407]